VSERPLPFSRAECEAEIGTALPAKEVISLLDLNVDVDLALALAAPIDLAVAANAQVALPIDAAVSANILSFFSNAGAVANQAVMIDQSMVDVHAEAVAQQDASVDQTDGGGDGDGDGGSEAASLGTMSSAPSGDAGTAELPSTDLVTTNADAVDGAVDDVVDELRGITDELGGITDELGGITDELGTVVGDLTAVVGELEGIVSQVGDTVGGVTDNLGNALDGALQDGLLNVDVKVELDADLAAPINGAIAANAQVAAPIDAAVAANVGSVGSEAFAIADQTAIITQRMEDVTATAVAEQDAEVDQ
jgi:hypothetical protein